MRRGIAIMGAIALSATLAACGSADNKTAMSGKADGAQSAAGTKGELGTITVWADDTRYPQLLEFSKDFTEKTKIGLNVVQKPTADIAQEFITQVPTGNGPDVIVTAHDGLGQLVENGVVGTVDLGSAKADLAPAAVQGVTYGG